MNESFEFTLTPRSNATIAALQSDEIVFGGDKDATEMKVAIDGLTNGERRPHPSVISHSPSRVRSPSM